MSDEFEKYDAFAKQMEERFPKMFANPYGGFCCGEGWWPILEALCSQIQHHIDWKEKQRDWAIRFNSTAPPGDMRPVPDKILQVTVAQIKEKFGGLRFYYDGGDDQIRGMVRMAEAWADATCEDCGAPATKQTSGWIKTVCDKHFDEREALRKERFAE
jgi:hypothetical protein